MTYIKYVLFFLTHYGLVNVPFLRCIMSFLYLLNSLKHNSVNCATSYLTFSVHLIVCSAGFRKPLEIGCHAMAASGKDLHTWVHESD